MDILDLEEKVGKESTSKGKGLKMEDERCSNISSEIQTASHLGVRQIDIPGKFRNRTLAISFASLNSAVFLKRDWFSVEICRVYIYKRLTQVVQFRPFPQDLEA